MANPYNTLFQYFTDRGWCPEHRQKRPNSCRFKYPGKTGNLTCIATIKENIQQFIFHIWAPITATPETQSSIVEFITRANFGRYIGHFGMNYQNGEISYKSSVSFKDDILSPQLIKNTVEIALQTMDEYAPVLVSVIQGEQQPLAALATVNDSFEPIVFSNADHIHVKGGYISPETK